MIFYLLEKLWCIHLLFCCILLVVEASVDLTTTSAIFLLLYIVPREKTWPLTEMTLREVCQSLGVSRRAVQGYNRNS